MDLSQYNEQFNKTIEHLKTDISSVRTNRATPALLENIQVEIYGSKMPLIQVASIQAPELKTLTVEPWDKQAIKDIEKGIQSANLGLNVANEGTFLRLSIPFMTEDTRKELIKVLNNKLEKARQAIRNIRDNIKEVIGQSEKDKIVSKDEKYKLIEDLDILTRKYNDQIKTIGDNKENEIKF